MCVYIYIYRSTSNRARPTPKDGLGTSLGRALGRPGAGVGQTWYRLATGLRHTVGQAWDRPGTDWGRAWGKLGADLGQTWGGPGTPGFRKSTCGANSGHAWGKLWAYLGASLVHNCATVSAQQARYSSPYGSTLVTVSDDQYPTLCCSTRARPYKRRALRNGIK